MKKILSLFMSLVMLLSIIAGLNLTANAGVKLYWPVPGHTNLSQGFHDGNAIDISDGTITGAKVIAAIGGTVTHKFTCTSQHYGSFGDCNGFGTGLVIKGTDGRVYQYAHMQGGSIPSGINVGSSVSSGQQIGKVGTTGNSSGAHLHFAITYTNYWDNSGINPANESYDYTDPSASLTFSINNTTNISTNSATVNFSISNPSNQTVSKVGMKIKKSSEANWSKTYEETLPSSIYKSSTLNTTYVIGSGKEVNYALSAGTEYTWIAYAVVGSKTYTSGNNKFKTTGSAPSSAGSNAANTASKCANGHKPGTPTVTKATLTDNGSITTKCTVCGYVSKTTSIPYVKTVTLSATSYTYDGKVKKPTVTVKDSKGNKIASSNYTVTYQSGRKNVGKYSVKVTFKGNYSGTKTLYFTIKPKNTSISSVTAKSKGFTVKLKKYTTQTTGYQIQYSTSSSFSSAKTVTLKNTTTSKTITGLTGNKKYYVRVRTYKTVGSTNYYSAWSKAKTVTTKK